MTVKLKKMESELLTKEAKRVGRWSYGQASCVRQGTQGTLAREHLTTQGTFAREYVSTQSTLESEPVSTQGTFAREHVTTQRTLACEHDFSMQGMQFNILLFIIDS